MNEEMHLEMTFQQYRQIVGYIDTKDFARCPEVWCRHGGFHRRSTLDVSKVTCERCLEAAKAKPEWVEA